MVDLWLDRCRARLVQAAGYDVFNTYICTAAAVFLFPVLRKGGLSCLFLLRIGGKRAWHGDAVPSGSYGYGICAVSLGSGKTEEYQ